MPSFIFWLRFAKIILGIKMAGIEKNWARLQKSLENLSWPPWQDSEPEFAFVKSGGPTFQSPSSKQWWCIHQASWKLLWHALKHTHSKSSLRASPSSANLIGQADESQRIQESKVPLLTALLVLGSSFVHRTLPNESFGALDRKSVSRHKTI